MPAAKFEITRQCKVCGETFVAKTIESWYCSPGKANFGNKVELLKPLNRGIALPNVPKLHGNGARMKN